MTSNILRHPLGRVNVNRGTPETINGVRVPYDEPTGELIRRIQESTGSAWAAYRALAQRTDPAARRALVDATGSDDWRHRRSAAEALGLGGMDDEVISRIGALLDDASAQVIRTALAVIEERGPKSMRPRVIKLMDSGDPETRRSAIRAIGVIAEEQDFEEILNRFLNDGVEEVRREAAWALYQQRSVKNWRRLVDEWKADHLHRHRVWACDLVAEFGGVEETSTLEGLEQDQDGHVRAAASRAKARVRERGGV